MMKREANFAILFRHWLRANPMATSAFELKDTRGRDYLSFDAIEGHQVGYAEAIEKQGGVLIRVQGTNGEPDYIYLNAEPAYIVIKYPRFFCLMEVWRFVHERKISDRKSLTSARAREIALKTVDL